MSVESSPDPLSILADECSLVRQSRGRKGPLAPRSSNINSSPTKSMILETKNADGGSPWRIRVTVQAEPGHDSNTKRINRTTKVPLRDAETSPVRRKGRPRKTNATSPARKDQTRKPTPVRRRRSQSKSKEPMQEIVVGDETILSDSGVNAYFDDVPTTTIDNNNNNNNNMK